MILATLHGPPKIPSKQISIEEKLMNDTVYKKDGQLVNI